MNRTLIGIDTGGTFTDFVLIEAHKVKIGKVLSTPAEPERAIMQGLTELSSGSTAPSIAHGSTVATNALLEGKGVKTAYIANRGLGDVLSIGRQARKELYNLRPPPSEPPVPRALILETGGRLAPDGRVLEPLTDADLEEIGAALVHLKPEAVAINLLFSFINDEAERAIEAAIPESIFVSRSSNVLPEYREYERGIATWLNAYIGPRISGYLDRLHTGLPEADIRVMQSFGEMVKAEQASRRAVHLLLSGPAGGLMGARYIGRLAGHNKLLTLDMGGTSTDVALVEEDIRLTSDGQIGGYPIAVPMVDMHTIGAGGGSIARIDAGGLLQAGPQSAGAEPGPAAYGRGGKAATVTDANVVLGRLPADLPLGGVNLDRQAAVEAFTGPAKSLGCSVEEAAEGVIRLANEHMAGALRVISVNRGEDPAAYTLMSFGGAGGLHVCALAEALGMHQAMVPIHAGVLSALGMVVAPPGRQLSRTLAARLDELQRDAVIDTLKELEARGTRALTEENVAEEDINATVSLDLRYLGQSFTLNLPWRDSLEAAGQDFHAAHRTRYGHELDQPIELVNVRVGLSGPTPAIELPKLSLVSEPGARSADVHVWGIDANVAVWERQQLVAGQIILGPAIVTEAVATSFVEPGWCCEVDQRGNLLLSTGGPRAADAL